MSDEDDPTIRNQKRLRNILNVLVVSHFLAPVIVLLLFISPILKDVLVPDLLSSDAYDLIKMGIVGLVCILRSLSFRREIQFAFDESYQLIHKMVITKNERLF